MLCKKNVFFVRMIFFFAKIFNFIFEISGSKKGFEQIKDLRTSFCLPMIWKPDMEIKFQMVMY